MDGRGAVCGIDLGVGLSMLALLLAFVAQRGVWSRRAAMLSMRCERFKPALAHRQVAHRRRARRHRLDRLAARGVRLRRLPASAAGSVRRVSNLAQSFFLGQVIGVASLVPGGFGSSDAFWIAHLPLAQSKPRRRCSSPIG